MQALRYFPGYYYLVHQDLATLVLLLAPHQGNSWAQGLGATRAGQPLKHVQCLSDFTGLIGNHLIPHLPCGETGDFLLKFCNFKPTHTVLHQTLRNVQSLVTLV